MKGQYRRYSKRKLAELISLEEIADGRTDEHIRKTLREWRDEYLAARPRLSPRTRRTYEDALRGFSKWFDRPLSDLVKLQIQPDILSL